MLMNIWVKDKLTGSVHQVGTNAHDSLELFDGVVHYVNMQCMEGTLGGGYEFCEAPDPDCYVSVTPDELLLNRDMIHKDFLNKVGKVFEKIWDDDSDIPTTDTCICCGGEIPEGRQVCPKCEKE